MGRDFLILFQNLFDMKLISHFEYHHTSFYHLKTQIIMKKLEKSPDKIEN